MTNISRTLYTEIEDKMALNAQIYIWTQSW